MNGVMFRCGDQWSGGGGTGEWEPKLGVKMSREGRGQAASANGFSGSQSFILRDGWGGGWETRGGVRW